MASRWRPRRPVVIGSVAVVILAAAGIGAYAGTRPAGHAYRTGLVTSRSITETLAETGTAVEKTTTTATFAADGTVRSVTVRAGEAVTAGQTLAALDTTSLAAALAAAKAATATAVLTLTKAEDGTLSAASGGGGTGSGGGTAAANAVSATAGDSGVSLLGTTARSAVDLVAAVATRPVSPAPTAGGSSGSIKTSIGAVTAGQHRLDADLATARALLARATAACAVATPPTTGSPTTSSPTATPSPTASVSPTPSLDACLTAESALLAAQQTVGGDESGLASAEASLDAALLQATTTTATGSGSGATTGGSTKTGSTKTGSTATGSSSTATTVTAAQLAAYQAKVDAATAAQAVAQQDLDLATLVSPITGTVLSVGLTAGSAAGSNGIVVAAPDGVVFTTAVPVTTVPRIAVGQAVSVVADGTATSRAGTVTAVAAAPDSSGDYTVTVGLRSPTASIRPGSTASLSIALASAAHVLSVPTSAITTLDTLHVVRVLSGGTVTAVPVTVGTQSALLTEVTGRLTAGEKVVLADLGAAVPASNTETTTTRGGTPGLGGTTGFGGTGGFAGAGGPGGRQP